MKRKIVTEPRVLFSKNKIEFCSRYTLDQNHSRALLMLNSSHGPQFKRILIAYKIEAKIEFVWLIIRTKSKL